MGLRIAREIAAVLFPEGAEVVEASGRLRLADFTAARDLQRRLDPAGEDPAVSAGRLNALDRLEELLRRRLESYLESRPEVKVRLLEELTRRLGAVPLRRLLERFALEYGDAAVVRDRERSAAERQDALAALLPDLVLFWAIDGNPAAGGLSRRLAGERLTGSDDYREAAAALEELLAAEPPLDAGSTSLADSLRTPGGEAGSLTDQLRGLLAGGDGLGGDDRNALLSALDLISEEEAPRFPPGPGPPPEVPSYAGLDEEVEAFSADREWMPRVVLMAKNCHVWLAQLSRRYGRRIDRLDAIPERELERLAGWGFTGLWLIGLWEPSAASARIKQLCGQHDAAPSAYSLHAYRIAAELGGREALHRLRGRAARHGLRLAADMVPNHMGIDSEWLIEHPERFLSTPTCPFPGYTFDGPDLSSHPDVGIYLEDHYYDRTDAAVVFKRVDRGSGDVRYVYHGNDGTSTPWNDTAQLDFLDAATREAVVDTILEVARDFPIIRFDAAMTLARRHIQRLWYPEPGLGGAIPSRAEHAMTREQMREAMPREFWRDVVDRVAAEAPETLLLAEAFWLMEGYFVRTLGMHRVYNSAFMHMLRDGATGSYRRLIRETLEFDAKILERYVNFLSNPDEATAVEQFGREERYLGAVTAMATLPGLPMFAHGQVEGLSEKYGMEFRAPQHDEPIDSELVELHERRVFPLLRRRGDFAEVDRFVLLDLVHDDGSADEEVLAFVNGPADGRWVVLFNNCDRRIAGRLRCARFDGAPVRNLATALALQAAPDDLFRFQDHLAGLRYLAAAAPAEDGDLAAGEEPGIEVRLEVCLEPWESRVLGGFEALGGRERSRFRRLEQALAGRGVPSLAEALRDLGLEPLARALGALAGVSAGEAPAAAEERLAAVEAELRRAVPEAAPSPLRRLTGRLEGAERVAERAGRLAWPAGGRLDQARDRLLRELAPDSDGIRALRVLVLVETAAREIEKAEAAGRPGEAPEGAPGSWRGVLGTALAAAGLEGDAVPEIAARLELARVEAWLEPTPAPGPAELAASLRQWLTEPATRRLLGWNRHDGFEWVGQEELERLAGWRAAAAAFAWLSGSSTVANRQERASAVVGWVDAMERLGALAARSGYRCDRLLARLEGA